MDQLTNIVRYENECTYLDFKQIQYKKESFSAFIKDIVAMANADIDQDRYIVIGVKPLLDGTRSISGINENLIDEATYQQVVLENIEPSIKLSYQPFSMDGKLLGIFKLSDCNNPPYMLRKDFGSLKKGDSFVRIGSHQNRLTRPDIDRIIEKRLDRNSFSGIVTVQPVINEKHLDTIKHPKDFILPSKTASDEIENILKNGHPIPYPFASDLQSYNSLNRPKHYGKSVNELEEELEDIPSLYFLQDMYCLFEENGYRINFSLLNSGNSYLEDATIILEFIKTPGYVIADQIYYKDIGELLNTPRFDNINYPHIKETETSYRIEESVGNLKHNIPIEVFPEPIRMGFNKHPIKEIRIAISIFGKNVRKSITNEMTLLIT